LLEFIQITILLVYVYDILLIFLLLLLLLIIQEYSFSKAALCSYRHPCFEEFPFKIIKYLYNKSSDDLKLNHSGCVCVHESNVNFLALHRSMLFSTSTFPSDIFI